ncbi:hypothetical protein ACOZ4Y_04940 [Komagataeibacter rhaeticus]
MGTATANSILVVSFARERIEEHGDALRAALEAGYEPHPPGADDGTRPWSSAWCPWRMSNSQNAPLGRAVIGGTAGGHRVPRSCSYPASLP